MGQDMSVRKWPPMDWIIPSGGGVGATAVKSENIIYHEISRSVSNFCSPKDAYLHYLIIGLIDIVLEQKRIVFGFEPLRA